MYCVELEIVTIDGYQLILNTNSEKKRSIILSTQQYFKLRSNHVQYAHIDTILFY